MKEPRFRNVSAVCFCRRRFIRPAGGSKTCLTCLVRRGLSAAGFTYDDPALAAIRVNNENARRRAGITDDTREAA